jgi:hypothetical protein
MTNTLMDTYGIICETYQYSLDGEYSSGYNEIDVEITEYWKTGELKNTAKEVRVKNKNIYYRMTKAYGWRVYYKLDKRFDNKNKYIGGYTTFIPNTRAKPSNNYSNINLGSW